MDFKEDLAKILSDEFDNSINELAELSSYDIQTTLQECYQLLKLYNNTFQSVYKEFLKANSIVRKVKALPSNRNKEQDKAVSVPPKVLNKKSYYNKKQATLDYIAMLEKGRFIFNSIRTMLTNQSIKTILTVQTSQGIYNIDEKVLKENKLITSVLSTFGGSTSGNPVNLAIELKKKTENQKATLLNILKNEGEEISHTTLYDEIWECKYPYLAYVKNWKKRGYSKEEIEKARVFNSKDAEIFNLMQQMELNKPGSTKNWLSVSQYAALRQKTGGGPGSHTRLAQLGDIGLVQNKFISERQSAVNVIRHSMINKRLVSLQQILESGNMNQIKEKLKTEFTVNKTQDLDEISKHLNEEAIKTIEEKFKGISGSLKLDI